MATTDGDSDDIGVDSAQLLLVCICIAGLVVAAFLAPVVGANNLVAPGGNGSLEEQQDRQPTDPEPADTPKTVAERGENGERDPGSEFEPGGGVAAGEYSGCFVFVEPEPTPGQDTSVLVTVGGEAAADVPVWFNGDFVGHTSEDGTVIGTVPFVTDLHVTVTSPTEEPCRFSRQDPAAVEGAGLVGAGTVVSAASATGAVAAGGISARARESPPPRRQQGDAKGVNNSTQYDVANDVSIRVRGDPIPGETVTLRATVAGAPMPDATVTVDGTRVGRTDANGRYALTVPDRDSVAVTVSRGEISGNTTVDVLELSVRFVPRLVVPGERATVAVTRGGEPVGNATVALDGATLGTTGQSGTVAVALPRSVGGTVRATAGPQSAAVPLWLAYWLTAAMTLLLAFLTALTTAIAAGMGGRGPAKRVAFVWGGVWALFVGYVVGEHLGLGVTAAAVVLLALYRYRRAVVSGGATTAGLIAGFIEWCSRAVLWVVGAVETLADWGRAGVGRLAAWVRWLRGREPEVSESEGTAGPATGSPSDPTAPTLRQLWRRLASRVFPGTWRTRTPAEVSRAAIERGLPRGPVETLTEAFRDVEYGGHAEASRQSRAEAAYDALEYHRDEEDGE
ncbi:hypothetical protein BRC96_02830 [Halobacteriales archaeon QS_6_64_34]|nr:MAG: hypothetical protein BRC96_02830 [Halobacteriales archaeon QS_6_64_34]